MQQGGSQYGAPPQPQQQQQQAELTPFHHVQMAPEAAPPISTRPPPPTPTHAGSGGSAAAYNFEELGAAADDPLGGVGEEGGSGGISGNRWPRQETLALLKIRSEMDAAFRDANLKGPLWEEVSRKLGELGYRRSAKKCKEKFENVHKYYKRTKEGRAGRQDGKSYRFFSQLEALHNTTASPSPAVGVSDATTAFISTPPPSAAAPGGGMSAQNPVSSPAARVQPMQISAPTPITTAPPQQPVMGIHDNPTCSTVVAAAAAGISFSSNTSSSSGSESDDDDDEATEEGPSSGRKRKREDGGGGGSGSGSRKMMAFFEGLMRQVMERQEAMQQRFLDAIEKREQDRMIREEAWRRQEMSRVAREHELAAQERAAAASRDASIISFLQNVTGQTVQLPSTTSVTIPTPVIQTPPVTTPPPQIHHHHQQQQTPPPPSSPPPPAQPSQHIQQHQHQHQQPQQQTPEIVRHHYQPPPPPPSTSTEMVPEPLEGTVVSVSLDPASSRWPKSEVHALIKLRSELDSRYQESGPKGPLWEEISAGMQRLGYNRSSKRCKEKWENINKYFKKVKESNKKRPEDAKTCPYFHQLDALYRSKQLGNSGGSLPASSQRLQERETGTNPNPNPNSTPNPNPNPSPITMIAPPQHQQQGETESKNGNGDNAEAAAVGGPSNGGIGQSFFGKVAHTGGGGGRDNSGIMKKPEDIMKELMGGKSNNNNNDYGKLDDADSDNMDEDDEDDDYDDEEDGKGQYRIQFQRQNVGNNGGTSGPATAAAAAPSTASGKASGSSFLAMVR